MKRIFIILLALVGVLTACQPAEVAEGELPTLAVLPTLVPTGEIIVPPTAEAEMIEPTATPTDTASATPLAAESPTLEAAPTDPPASTDVPVIRTQATLSPEEQPRIITLTPGGSIRPNATPQVLADFVISEEQFQLELNRQLQNIGSVEAAAVNFVPGGMNIQVTAMGGQALITGDVAVSVQLTGSFATITLGQITTNAPEPPEAFILTVGSDLFPALVAVMDEIITTRVGPEQNLHSINMTDSTMELMLLVPER